MKLAVLVIATTVTVGSTASLGAVQGRVPEARAIRTCAGAGP